MRPKNCERRTFLAPLTRSVGIDRPELSLFYIFHSRGASTDRLLSSASNFSSDSSVGTVRRRVFCVSFLRSLGKRRVNEQLVFDLAPASRPCLRRQRTAGMLCGRNIFFKNFSLGMESRPILGTTRPAARDFGLEETFRVPRSRYGPQRPLSLQAAQETLCRSLSFTVPFGCVIHASHTTWTSARTPSNIHEPDRRG